VTQPPPGPDRRQFLQLLAGVAGAAGAGVVLGACGGPDGAPNPLEQTPMTRADTLEGDLAIAALLASMENLLVATYQEGLDRRDRLGPYPPGVQAMVEGALAQHRQHAVAWNSILTGAGKAGITGVNLTLRASLTEGPLLRARDFYALLGVCQDLEGVNAITYLHAIGALENNAAVKVAASIHPVEHQHVAVLTFLNGQKLATESFGRSDGARTTADTIG
jgi:hypothetical protein